MKKLFLVTTLFIFYGNLLIAQTTKSLKKSLELRMPKDAGDADAGSNGASVVWHPVQNKYYAAMAGNIKYPLAVFNETGKRLSSENMVTSVDLRGLWYNPIKKTLCGNGYGSIGWFHYILDPKGTVLNVDTDIQDMAQPNNQCVGTFNTGSNEVMFLNGNRVSLYSNIGSLNKDINLRLGLTEKDDIGEKFQSSDETPEEYNYTSVIYTGQKGAELGLLNIEKNQIELYDFETGFLTSVLKVPESQVIYPAFCFAFSNGQYWLYNKETRIWTSYK